MLIRLTTVGPMDCANYNYAIVFNTSGNGQTPFANAYATSLLNYSFVWLIGTQNVSQGGCSVAPVLYQVFQVNNGLAKLPVAVPTSSYTFTPNSNGLGSQFTLQFQRSLFYTAAPIASPSANVTPTAAPTTASQQMWNINVFTLDANNNNAILDAGGGGPNNAVPLPSVNTAISFDNTNPFNVSVDTSGAPAAAQIAGGEIQNTP